jgi:histidyl-tRNA synthetase
VATSRPTPLSGFPELLPAQRLAEQEILDGLRRVFELHGFAGIETRAVETVEQLGSKGEVEKEIYVLRRLHADPDAPPDDAASQLGLHFDLTVPFARYVLENAGKLEFPFRRHQIQKAWRGERPQEGRFREFTQADIDVVGRDELPFHHDVEVAQVMAEALSTLHFLPRLRMQVNNRRLLQGFYAGIGVGDPAAAMRVVDKLDKQSPHQVARTLVDEVGLSAQQADQCLELAGIRSGDASFVDAVKRLGVEHELLERGLSELRTVVEGCAGMQTDRLTIEADLSVARGLDYYTGTVFETRMSGFESLGSICSGGRYDSLASDGRTTYPGVGISLGVSRLLVPLFQRGLLGAARSVPSAVLVALPDEASRADCDAVAQALRARGIAAEVAASAQKYGKQIRYAERRGIPFVWFPPSGPGGTTGTDGGHEVKDIRSGEQVPADPDAWTPPPSDLRPQVTVEEELS